MVDQFAVFSMAGSQVMIRVIISRESGSPDWDDNENENVIANRRQPVGS